MHIIWISLFAFGASTVHGLRAFQELWAAKCKTFGVEYNSAKDFKNFQEFTSCSEESLNATQFMEDTNAMMEKFNLTQLDFSTIKPTLQHYCSQAVAYLNCGKKLSTECLTEEENLRWTIYSSLRMSFVDFFCQNDANGITEFTNGNGIECGMAKQLELYLCFEEFYNSSAYAALVSAAQGDIFILFATLPTADILCNLIETAGNCIKQLFQQCELSKIPAKMITDLSTYIETETKCATIPKIDIQRFNFQSLTTVLHDIQPVSVALELNATSNTNTTETNTVN